MDKPTNMLPKVSKNVPVSSVVQDAPTAPVIYFDGVVAAGHRSGIISANLVVQRHVPDGEKLTVDLCTIAHLKTSIAGAKEMIALWVALVADAEREAMLAAAPTGLRN
jgi:hypothetical protein